MKETLYSRYTGKKPIGIYSLSAFLGIAVYEPEGEDKYKCDFVTAWANESNYWGFARNKVHFSAPWRMYVRKGNLHIYLDEIMKMGE